MSMKIAKIPESDITARKPDSDEEDSRPEFATGPAAKHKAGAFGKPKPPSPTLHGLPGEVSQKGPKTRKKT
jgi:hypothetical protein